MTTQDKEVDEQDSFRSPKCCQLQCCIHVFLKANKFPRFRAAFTHYHENNNYCMWRKWWIFIGRHTTACNFFRVFGADRIGVSLGSHWPTVLLKLLCLVEKKRTKVRSLDVLFSAADWDRSPARPSRKKLEHHCMRTYYPSLGTRVNRTPIQWCLVTTNSSTINHEEF